jgi:hypothetical protein
MAKTREEQIQEWMDGVWRVSPKDARCLGQAAVPDGSNEIAAIPELLRTLELAGAL